MSLKLLCLPAALLFSMSLSPAVSHAEEGFIDRFQSLDGNFWHYSNGWANGEHQACEWRTDGFSIVKQGVQMKIAEISGGLRPYSCPEMHTVKTTGYGIYEARLRVAAGSGLNTNIFTYTGPPTGSPEHDEIDFEFLGKNTKTVQINYFTNGQGKHEIMVPLGFDASQGMHNYAIEWAPNKIRWYVDGKKVSETPADAVLPRNPSRFYISLWAGSSIVDSWLGPFKYTAPITAEVEWAAFTPTGSSCLFPQSVTCKKSP